MSDMGNKRYKLVLGLEIHMHLKTSTKMFCGCSTDIYDSEPNTRTCPVCLGLPGALPVPNSDAVKKTQMLGLALNCSLNQYSYFDRKHYFYPDLPKGYQISQYKKPLCEGGFLELDSGEKKVIERVHLEEDTAKSFHQGDRTLIDFNKSGMPLVEIVTRPVFYETEEAVEFCKKIQAIVRTLVIGDGDMEKGQMRLEANISLRTDEMQARGELSKYKVEVKNINSFRFMEKAVNAEIERQTDILKSGGVVIQENRGYNEASGKTVSQRSKEEAHDYRYFPEPDIPPMVFSEEYINNLKSSIPILPSQMVSVLRGDYGINPSGASTLVYIFGKDMYNKFIEVAEKYKNYEKIVNSLINKKEYRDFTTDEFVERIKQEEEKNTDKNVLENIVINVIKLNTKAVDDYRRGNKASIEYLLGQVMRETKGTAEPGLVREIITQFINK